MNLGLRQAVVVGGASIRVCDIVLTSIPRNVLSEKFDLVFDRRPSGLDLIEMPFFHHQDPISPVKRLLIESSGAMVIGKGS